MRIVNFLAGAAALGAVAAPAAAQYYPQQQPYQQPYAQPYQQAYPQQAYPGTGYNQSYGYNQGTGSPVTDIIDSLLGNRYNVSDRQAVRQCASAAMTQAGQRYAGGGYNRGAMRVTQIGEVQRRGNGLRVSGMMSSASAYGANGYGGNGYANGYQNRGYGQGYGGGSVSFRCDVAYNGAVTGIRIGRNY
jgi:hypothetical protein